MRALDLGTKEHVELLWIMEGQTYLRCHRGSAFMYHDGAFQIYRGMISESTLTRVKDMLWELEGLFRLMPKELNAVGWQCATCAFTCDSTAAAVHPSATALTTQGS